MALVTSDPRPQVRLIATCMGLVLAAACGRDDTTSATETAPAGVPAKSTVSLAVDPFVDLYAQVRASAEAGDDVAPLFAPAVAAANALAEVFGGHQRWGPVDGLLGGATDPKAFTERVAALPDPLRTRDGRELALRTPALALAAALEATLPAFLEEAWPARRAALEEVSSALDNGFAPKLPLALAYHLAALGIEDSGAAMTLFLVTDAKWPGASTAYGPGGVPFAVVEASSERVDTELYEILIHEATHGFDLLEKDDVFDRLRARLGEREGLAPGIRRNLPHALMFVQSAATVRQVYDPDHAPYGETSGVYGRLGPGVAALRENWGRYLAGEIDREAAITAIAEDL